MLNRNSLRAIAAGVVIFGLTAASAARAASVALLEVHDQNGNVVQFEPDGRFGHCAIKVGNLWLHAHHDIGVELTYHISHYGRNAQVFTNPAVPEPTVDDVTRCLELEFDRTFSWANDGTTYNARLVGELLGIKPLPAHYMAEIWREYAAKPGAVGLSPDDIYRAIVALGFKLERTCEHGLVH